MKRLLTLTVLGLFGAAIAGCEASGRVGDDDDSDSYRRTTTVRDVEGDTTRTETRTEIKRDVDD